MDKSKFLEYFRGGVDKYKYILMVCLMGVILVSFPGGGSEPQDGAVLPEADSLTEKVNELEKKLEEVLGSMAGVGRVKVAITADTSSQTVYAYDEDKSMTVGNDSRSVDSRTSLVSIGSSGNPQALAVRTDQPAYRGAVVVCEGAENAAVRLEVAQVVSSLVGIGTDRIVVSKMKN